MKPTSIYVAGPVLRPDSEVDPRLRFLYGQIQAEATVAQVHVRLPYVDGDLDKLNPQKFAEEITRHIKDSDAVILLLLRGHVWIQGPPYFSEYQVDYASNSSVACEGQIAVHVGKPVTILTDRRTKVPRLIQALAGEREPHTVEDVNYHRLFREITESIKSKRAHDS